ncbi:MAG: response regulator [Burkholderiales bacterium]|nr:response regulator [Burkholderiales bacterium]
MQSDRKTRILIIDDDVGFRDLLRIHLAAAGYQVRVAEDGVTGGRALLEQTPDLVVSDLNMPFLDGFELLRLLHGDEETASIPVILLSGRSDGDTMAKAVELGAADYLTKPVTRDQLLESIEACLSRTKGRTNPPDYGSTPIV